MRAAGGQLPGGQSAPGPPAPRHARRTRSAPEQPGDKGEMDRIHLGLGRPIPEGERGGQQERRPGSNRDGQQRWGLGVGGWGLSDFGF